MSDAVAYQTHATYNYLYFEVGMKFTLAFRLATLIVKQSYQCFKFSFNSVSNAVTYQAHVRILLLTLR